MRDFNTTIVSGNLGRDPELRYTPQGNAVADFSLANNDKRGEEEVTTWFRVTVWGKQAESVSQHLTKGRKVIVQGRVSLDTFEKRDGTQGYSLVINASTVQFLPDGKGNFPGNEKPVKVSADTDEDMIPF